MPSFHNFPVAAIACLGISRAAPAFAQEPAAAPAAAEPAPVLSYSNKWRLQVSEGANNDGVMRIRVTPKDGAPVDVPVSLKDGRGEDGEDVLVKVRKGPAISIELVESTVKGTRINFDRE